jgi:hypothetical protein
VLLLSYTTGFFCFSFPDRVSHFYAIQPRPRSSYFHLLSSRDYRYVPSFPAWFLIYSLTNFLLRLALNLDPPDSASQVAGITGASHHTWLRTLDRCAICCCLEGSQNYFPDNIVIFMVQKEQWVNCCFLAWIRKATLCS